MKRKLQAFLKRPVLKQFSGGIACQMIQSAANFILSMIVARACSKTEYGLYTVAFATLIIVTSVQNALFNGPFQVIAPGKNEKDRTRFTSGIALDELLFFIGLSLLSLAAYGGYGIFRNDSPHLFFVLALIITGCAWAGREFVRTLNSSHLNMKALLSGEIAFAGIAFIATMLFWQLKILNCQYALLCLAGGCAMGSIIGLVQSKQRFSFRLIDAKAALKETSPYAWWALIGVIISTIQSQSYVYLLSIMTNLSETAEINAAKMFLMPIGLLSAGISRIFLPKGSELLNHGDGFKRLMKLTAITIAALLLLSIIYCASLSVFFKQIILLTIGNKYASITQYFLLWSGIFIAQVIRTPLMLALLVFKKFKYTAMVGAVSAAVTLTVSFLGMKSLGGKSMLVGMLVGEVTGFLVYLPLLKYKTLR
jgi:O-antigen/teichoic acid export membrane protein